MTWTWTRMTDEELVQFSQDFVEGRVFTTYHIPPEDQEALVPQIFTPLAFGALDVLEDVDNIGAIWAYLSEATAMEVDGYPVFSEMRVMHMLDWKLASTLIHRMQQT